jgi:hypothetical protein
VLRLDFLSVMFLAAVYANGVLPNIVVELPSAIMERIAELGKVA